MFGLNEITWAEFFRFILISLAVWYSLLLTTAWIKSKQKITTRNFENYHSEIDPKMNLQPITVSSHDYPSQIFPVNPVENVPFPSSVYEETGYDEGLALDHFSQKNHPVLAKMITEFQYQQ